MNQDDLLGLLISVAESGGARFPVILSVGGNIIEGEVVTEREYFEEMASMIGGDPDSKEVFANIPGWMDEAAMRGLDEGGDPEEIREVRESMATSYIHLRNSALWVDGNPRNMQGTLWRGKLEAVDGFWLGRTP